MTLPVLRPVQLGGSLQQTGLSDLDRAMQTQFEMCQS